jgi:hypothetical protein
VNRAALPAWVSGLWLAGACLLAGCQAAAGLVQDLTGGMDGSGAADPEDPAVTAASSGAAIPSPGMRKGSPPAGSGRPQQAESLLAYDPKVGIMDITRADGSACRAPSDVGMLGTTANFAKLSARLYATGLLKQVGTPGVSDLDLQRSLDEIRPILKQISLHTVWLPLASERYAGEALYARRKSLEYQPSSRDARVVDQDILPMFEELKRLAAEELKSDLPFDLRLINDTSARSPQVLSGGIVLIPSGMIQRLRVTKDRRQILGFMLAHEFSHALRRHYTKMLQGNLVDTWTTASEFKQVVRKDAGAFKTISSGNLGALFDTGKANMERLVTSQCQARNWYSTMDQRQELEADVCGALLLHRLAASTGETINPAAAWASYVEQGFAVQPEATQAGSCDVAPSHPDAESRGQNLEQYWKVLSE